MKPLYMANVPEMDYSQGYDDSKLTKIYNQNVDNKKPKVKPIHGIGTLVKEGLISFVRIDHSVFQKTEAEKKAIKKIKHKHVSYIKMCGCDPRKTLNLG